MKPFTFSVADLLNLNSKVPPAMPYIPRYLAPDTVVLTSKTYQVQNRYQKGGNLTSIASYLVIYLPGTCFVICSFLLGFLYDVP